MTAFAYVGAAEDAAGFRLAGARCWTPRLDETDALREALASGVEAVFITAEVAERVARAELEAALAAGRPLVVVLPEPGLPPCRLDPAERVRAQLGLDF
jgi:vacuolar-type H+-ATPase subunit F/Vma7